MSGLNIAQEVENLMAEPTNRDLSRLKDADDFYNSLLKMGLTKKRGYTLLGIDDAPNTSNIGLNLESESFNYRPSSNL